MVTPTCTQVVNIAAYKFVPLDNLPTRRAELKSFCSSRELKGTILLSPEGINLFMAGPRSAIDQLTRLFRVDWGLADIEVKESYSEAQPFNRLLVKLKREIIAFGIDGIEPARHTSPKLRAKQLKEWLDQGRPVRLLDVRNDYEVELGTFSGAEQLKIGHFREFPEAVRNLPEDAKSQPLVMFCTGGIRCEKAGPLMERLGFEQVYQLDGGILKYFEECGGDHYRGACFVFDGRVALDPQLHPTGLMTCYACQAILTHDDVQSERYKFAEYCPHCYRSHDQQLADRITARKTQLQKFATPLPGSQPYENVRQMHVARKYAGLPLLDFLKAYHPQTEAQSWSSWIERGEITCQENAVMPDQIVAEGQTFTQVMPNTVEPWVNADIEFIYEDDSLVIINKPAPLPVHPSGRFNRNTLQFLLSQVYRPEKLRFAHRLDALTTGLLIVCRKRAVAAFVQPQFERQQVEKVYLARIIGSPTWQQTECRASIAPQPLASGGRAVAVDAQSSQDALTHFNVLQQFPDNTTLVEARPHTGRTHQIRLHLKHLGHPVLGDPIYSHDANRGPQTYPSTTYENAQSEDPSPPLHLHAWKIRFIHPQTKQFVEFETTYPAWARNAQAGR